LPYFSEIKLFKWSKDDYFNKPEALEKTLLGIDSNFKDTIERIHVNDLTVEEFREKYERPGKPVIITGVTENWAAKENWKVDVSIFNQKKLYERFKDAKFKIGEDDDGKKIKVLFKEYLQYMLYNRDDSPLYLFESNIENNKDAHVLI